MNRLPTLCCALLATLMIGCESTKSNGCNSAPAGSSRENASTYKSYAKARGPVRVLRTTAYHSKEADHIVYGTKSAYGTNLRYGKVRSAAADWSRFPVGTVFRIVGLPHLFIVDDYGSALVGKDTLDLYTRSQQEMNFWGVRHVKVEFLRWGSYDKSFELLSQRLQYPHCRQMAVSIKAKRPNVGRGTGLAKAGSPASAGPKS